MADNNNEGQRLFELANLEVLDSQPESAFNDIVALAAKICSAPIALITLLDAERQWFKAKIGMSVNEAPRKVSFCSYTIEQDDVLVVPDLSKDPRFANNPFVTGKPNIRFYAGAPLKTANGFAIGTICVGDLNPREFSQEQRETLKILASQTLSLLQLRKANILLKRERDRNRQIQECLNLNNIGIWEWNIAESSVEWNPSMYSLYEVNPGEGKITMEKWRTYLREKDNDKLREDLLHRLNSTGSYNTTFRIKAGSGVIKTINSIGKVVSLQDGKPTKVLGISWDVSKETEQHLFYNGIFNESAQPIIVLDPSGTFKRVNPAFIDLLGYSEQQLIGKHFTEITHPDDLARDSHTVKTAVNTGRDDAILIEKRYRHIHGHYVPVAIRSKLVKSLDGTPKEFLSFVMDLTESRRREEARQKSELLFKTLFDFAPIGIVLIDDEGKYLKTNLSYQKMLGYSEEEFLHLNIVDVTHPEDISVGETILRKCKEGASDVEVFRKRKIRRDKTEIWTEISFSKVPFGDVPCYVYAVEDITQKQIIESALRTAHSELKFFYENINEGIIFCNRDGKFHKANPAALSILGVLENQLLGRSFADPRWRAIREDYANFSPDELPPAHSLKTGQPQSKLVIGIIKGNTEQAWISVNAIPIFRNKDPLPNEVLISFHDITDLKNTEQSLLQSREAERRANAAKSEFLSNISHEIRTPLNGIVGMTDILSRTNLQGDQVEYVNAIVKSGNILANLVNDLLDLAKIEAGKIDIVAEDININQLLHDVVSPHRINALEKGISFVCNFPTINTAVRGDISILNQIFNNLLSNAVKFTPEGKVTFSVSTFSETPTDIGICFKVSDTGIGMAKTAMDKLFQAFSQGDRYVARQVGGTGLGLAIVKKLVELIPGKIRVESEEGKGSSFFVEIVFEKCTLSHEDKASQETTAKEIGQLVGNILVAEDNLINQSLISKMLTSLGCNAKIVSNGIDVLAALKTQSYDLILMDCRMPQMDGYEATRLIRKNPNSSQRDIKILALTANASKSDRNLCFTSGMDGIIAKPITRQKLYNTLVKYLKTKDNP